MDKFFSCFSCEYKSNNIIIPQQCTPRKYIKKQTEQSLLEESEKTKTMTTLTFRHSDSTRIVYDSDLEMDKFIQKLKRKPLLERKKIEANFIKKNLESDSEMYMIQKRWSQEYTLYLNISYEPAINNMREINNQRLFDGTKLKVGLQQRRDYYLVTKKVWDFVKKMYGGGPQAKKQMNIPIYIMPVCRLKNNLYYCFINTAIQVLFSIGEFVYYYKNKLYNRLYFQTKSLKKIYSIYTYKIIKEFIEDSQVPKSLKDFSQIFQDRFHQNQQQDCQEFIRYYLENLQDQTNPIPSTQLPVSKNAEEAASSYIKYHTSIVDTLFFGQNTSIVKCIKCENISTTYQPFLDLIIEIKKDNLQSCLKNYFSQQKLTDLYECEKCKSKTKAIKQCSISKTPAYLMITLKRFTGNKQKNFTTIQYPYYLNIEDFCKPNSGIAEYTLHSIIIHKGTLQKGHYYCISRRAKKWYSMNDQKIQQVSIKQHMDQQAYMLIYQREK